MMKVDPSKFTLVLNNHYMPIGIQPSIRAFVGVYTGSVELLINHEDSTFASPNKKWNVPSIIRTRREVNLPYKKSQLTARNIFKRDGHTCQYCGSTDKTKLTIDHILPKSRGGKNTWKNMTTSCFKCNNEKGNRTPEEMGWEVPVTFHPHSIVLMSRHLPDIPDDWKPYLMIDK